VNPSAISAPPQKTEWKEKLMKAWIFPSKEEPMKGRSSM